VKAGFKSYCGIILLLAISMMGCEKNKSQKELLIGKWELKSGRFIYYENDLKIDEETEYYDPGEMQFEFLKDGTGHSYANGKLAESFTWTLEGKSLTIYSPGDTMEMDIRVKEDTLTLKLMDSTVDGEITHKTEITYNAKKITE
jgi:hypothetical protein